MGSSKTKAPVLIRSIKGLELIPKNLKELEDSIRIEPKEFAARIEADHFTFQRYAGVKMLPIWEVLALHYFLEPRNLMLNLEGRLGLLKRLKLDLLPHIPRVFQFLNDVDRVLKDVAAGHITCIKNTSNLLISYMDVRSFAQYALEKGIRPISGLKLTQVSPSNVSKISTKLPRQIREQLEGMKMWHTFFEQKKNGEPDLEKFFKGKGYSERLSRAMDTLCRPTNAPKGRRIKGKVAIQPKWE